jgi:sugar lactone lactonase YvrE
VIADAANNRIRRIDAAGIITTIAGNGRSGYAGDGGPATEAELRRPRDLAIAPDGTIYVSDKSNHCIRRIDPEGTISTAVGRCNPAYEDIGFAGDGGPLLEAMLAAPSGLYLDGQKLYIADSVNHRIRVANLP